MMNFYASIIAMVLVLGVDAGGTASRAVLTTPGGDVLHQATAGPGNPSAQGAVAAVHIGTAVREALNGEDPARVAAAVVGIAGISGLSDPEVADAFEREWKAIGLTCDVNIVGDAVTAFAAGTDRPRGAVLIAGTGAVAALVDATRIVRTADGLGWLLGDEGSGLWLGLQAVRAAARHMSPLTGQVMAAVGVSTSDALINWAGRQPPSAFAELAPLVCASADPVAHQIIADAASRLINTLDELQSPNGPVVLAGGLLTADTPVRTQVLELLRARRTDVHIANDPAVGAARLAARRQIEHDGQTPT